MPTKATYLLFEADPGLEFDHYLALELGRTVAELRATLSQQEWLEWSIYFARKNQREELAAKARR